MLKNMLAYCINAYRKTILQVSQLDIIDCGGISIATV